MIWWVAIIVWQMPTAAQIAQTALALAAAVRDAQFAAAQARSSAATAHATTVNLNSISANALQWMGDYSPTVYYGLYCVVTYSGVVYVSLVEGNRGCQPDSSPSKWAPLGGGGASTGSAEVFGSGEMYSVGASETWIAEYLVNFDALSSSVKATLAGFTRQDNSLGATYFLRVGGTPGAADGTIIASLFTSQSSYPSSSGVAVGSSFLNPGGWKLVKLSASGSSSQARAYIKQLSIGIS